MQNCVFCKIVARQLPSLIVAENEQVLVFKDIAPKATTHNLIIPKRHIPDLQAATAADSALLAALLQMAQQLARDLPGSQAFRLISNNGAAVGQTVYHLHFHFLAGQDVPSF